MKSCITLLLFLSTCVLCTPPILPVVLYSDGLLFLPAFSTRFFKSLFPSSICDFQLIFPQLLLAPTITNHPLLSTPKSRRYLYGRLFTSLFHTPPPTIKNLTPLPTRAEASEFGLERRQSRKASSLAYIICICILRMQSMSARRFAYSGSHFQTSFPYLNLGKFTYSSFSLPFPLNFKHFLLPHYHTAIHSQNENTTATHSHFAYITATFSKCEGSATL